MRPITVPFEVVLTSSIGTLICSLALPVIVHGLFVELLVRVALLEGFWRLLRLAVPFVDALPVPEKSSTGFLDVTALQLPPAKVNCQIAPGWVVMMVVVLPLTVKPYWILAIACWVAMVANCSAWVLEV